ncbi:MAG TPA: amidase [Vicinamibacterales bacterium]|nr:amidase [Vicinamibacterales bacterium]
MDRREVLAALLGAPFVVARSLRAQAVDLTSLSIAEAAKRLAARAITPLQLTNAYLARIAKLNPALNAYVTVTEDLARTDARALREPRGAMWGIPIAHKDLFETKGVKTTAGSLLFEDHIPEHSAAIVDQLANAGAVLLGKTNTHELGGGVTTINPFTGTTRNPVDPQRIAGGSSGGSAAAVVAHLCAAATGSDTGGSVRIPAAFCGCVGFKPTHGRFSTRGLIAASPTFDHVGFLTRTVEDAQIMSGLSRDTLATTRIGVARKYFFDELDPAVTSALNSVTASGQEIEVPVSAAAMRRMFDPIFAFEMWGRFGADWRTNPGSFSKSMAGFFATPRPSVAQYEEALGALKEYQAAVDRLFDSVDVIITPTVPVTAPLIGGRIDGMKILRNTWPFNAAGTPAVSIPVRAGRFPVGLQLIARRGDDDKLLQIARTFS